MRDDGVNDNDECTLFLMMQQMFDEIDMVICGWDVHLFLFAFLVCAFAKFVQLIQMPNQGWSASPLCIPNFS